jgi:hypothetical protein
MLSTLEANDLEIYDFHFNIDSGEATYVVSFEYCKYIPLLYGSCKYESHSDEMYTTHQSNNISFESILYQFSLRVMKTILLMSWVHLFYDVMTPVLTGMAMTGPNLTDHNHQPSIHSVSRRPKASLIIATCFPTIM